MSNRVWMMSVGAMMAVVGCGGTGGGTGGDGGSASGGTGGSAGTTTTSSSSGSGGSGTTATTTSTTSSTGGSVETCGASVPKACSYPEDALGFDPSQGDAGPVYPYPGEAEAGGSASCMGPFDAARTFTRALVGFPGPVPGTIALDVWTQDGRDPGERVPAWAARTFVDTSEMAGLTFGRYEVDITVPAGEVVCVGAPLAEYVPRAMTTGACFEPRRTWWYGVPIVDGIASWAMLECPEDKAISPYGFDLSYGLE